MFRELLFAFFPPVIHAMYAMRGNTASSPFTALWISSQIRGFHTVWCRFRVRCNVFTGCWSRLTARSPFQLQQDIFCSLTADQVVSASQLKNWTVFCTDLFTGLENFSDLDEYETSESKLRRTVSCQRYSSDSINTRYVLMFTVLVCVHWSWIANRNHFFVLTQMCHCSFH